MIEEEDRPHRSGRPVPERDGNAGASEAQQALPSEWIARLADGGGSPPSAGFRVPLEPTAAIRPGAG